MIEDKSLKLPDGQKVGGRATMAGKPVYTVESRILNLESGFKEKKLCDGPTFSTGTACVYSCSFCYVPAIMAKTWALPMPHESVVVRREKPVETIRNQLLDSKGNPKFLDANDQRVIYASPLVDVAANMELVRETAEIILEILSLTHWRIRLLSKSNLLPHIAKLLDGVSYLTAQKAKARIIYGVSTGTLDDKLAAAFEQGCPKVSKRIESLHWLQDNGYRTFGMICPSLPQTDYPKFAREMAAAIRADRCEHVWAEVINTRGDSFKRTYKALYDAGYTADAELLRLVSEDADIWEGYARATFEAHAAHIAHSKLRFLQYVNKDNFKWWNDRTPWGAVLLGKLAHA